VRKTVADAYIVCQKFAVFVKLLCKNANPHPTACGEIFESEIA
jgi:hypothetical protein